jgi:two-component system LytT family response regulator
MRALIVDDEDRGIVALQELLRKYCPEVSVVGTASDIYQAASLIRAQKPDVVFLDIAMPGGNGFQLLELFDHPDFETIFVTAHHEFAISALKLSALDYLLKPVNIDELQTAVRKLFSKRSPEPADRLQYFRETWTGLQPMNKIVLSDMGGFHFVNISDIVYCEADEAYTHIHLLGKRPYTASRPLKEYEELFAQHHFFRIHKSYLVNLEHVAMVSKDFQITMHDGKELPLSVRKRGEFFSLLKEMKLM